MTPSEATLLETNGIVMSETIFPLTAEAVFWGIYAIIVSFSLRCMSIRRVRTRAWFTMLILIVLLFIMSTMPLVSELYTVTLYIDRVLLLDEEPILSDRTRSTSVVVPLFYSQNWVLSTEFLIGDAIVIWRTWALWQGSRMLALPIVLWLAALGTLIAERVVYITSGAMEQAQEFFATESLTIASFSLSVATNAVATAMIAYKALKYRRFIRRTLGRRRGPTYVERVLSLLVESGLVYLCFWAISIATNFNFDFGPTSMFFNVWGRIGNQVVGLYPTVIIALVEIQRSVCQDLGSISVTRSFRPPSISLSSITAGNATNGSTLDPGSSANGHGFEKEPEEDVELSDFEAAEPDVEERPRRKDPSRLHDHLAL